ncbi:hypothetical protein B4134_0702 [Bacillus safensis]|nr:hypothetical protein B4134_0702 [Bacillus safensis]
MKNIDIGIFLFLHVQSALKNDIWKWNQYFRRAIHHQKSFFAILPVSY